MSATYVREYYGVDYKVGDRLVMDGEHGTLRSFPGQYLGIKFDGETRVSRCHPTWEIAREGATGERVTVFGHRRDDGSLVAWDHAEEARAWCEKHGAPLLTWDEATVWQRADLVPPPSGVDLQWAVKGVHEPCGRTFTRRSSPTRHAREHSAGHVVWRLPATPARSAS